MLWLVDRQENLFRACQQISMDFGRVPSTIKGRLMQILVAINLQISIYCNYSWTDDDDRVIKYSIRYSLHI